MNEPGLDRPKPSRTRTRHLVGARAVALSLVVCAVLLAACAPPTVLATSPFYGNATRGAVGRWEGNLLTCTADGGPVTAEVTTPYDLGSPYLAEIFNGWGTDPASLIATRSLTNYGDQLVSPTLPPGTCFHVRIQKLGGNSFNFWFTITW